MSKPPFRTLVLDLDGTVIDSVPDLCASCNRLAAARGLALFEAAEVQAMVGDGAAALVRRVLAARGLVSTEADLDAFLTDYMAHVAEHTTVYPGVAETLADMASDGWRLAICTNKPEAPARAILHKLGLLDRFAVVAGGDTYPMRKPDPAHLLATLAAAGGVASAAVMVGDHHNDVLSASGAGIPCIFAAWGYGVPAMAEGAAASAATFPDIAALAEALLPLERVRRVS